MGRSVVGNMNIFTVDFTVYLFLNLDMTVVGIQKTENKITKTFKQCGQKQCLEPGR